MPSGSSRVGVTGLVVVVHIFRLVVQHADFDVDGWAHLALSHQIVICHRLQPVLKRYVPFVVEHEAGVDYTGPVRFGPVEAAELRRALLSHRFDDEDGGVELERHLLVRLPGDELSVSVRPCAEWT